MDQNKKKKFIDARKKYALGGHVLPHYDLGGIVGSIGGILGLGGGAGGSGFAAPQKADVINPFTAEQTKQSYQDTQSALGAQNQLLGQLQGQQGLQNQSNVYNQLQGIASGQGPNVAKSQLNQATAQNVANQAALMAGQRGASANVGLLARQAAQQGAATQQQAAQQAATLQAQQTQAALGQMGGLANTQAAQQIAQTQANTAAQQAQQNAILGATQGVNQANIAAQGQLNSANAALAQARMGQQPAALSGVLGALPGVGQVLGGFLGGGGSKGTLGAINDAFDSAEGGGGELLAGGAGDAGGISSLLSAAPELALVAKGGVIKGQPYPGPHKSHVANYMAGGKTKAVPAMVSPGEIYLSPKEVQKVTQEGANPLKIGKKIPGKAVVKGNSYANDTVPATLEEGGVVIPRNVVSKMSREKAEQFVHKSLKKSRK